MKKLVFLAGLFFAIFVNVSYISAQSDSDSTSPSAQSGSPVNGQSMNGSTGLYSIPSGHIGWEDSSFGLDFGYRAVINNIAGVSHIPSITTSFFKWVEISLAMDIQPDVDKEKYGKQKNEDLLLGLKVKLPTNSKKKPKNPAISLGGNFHFINVFDDNHSYTAYQPYIAITYIGSFFNMSAETTIVVGKTLYSGGPENDSNIDFGMGFDLVLFPDIFKNAVHWIIDFANFSYSDNSWPNNSLYHTTASDRGILNTGFRIALSPLFKSNRFKLIIDLVFNDLFDAEARSFTAGAVIGFSK